MSLFTFNYDENIEEATVYFYEEFEAMHKIIQLDCLQDAIVELQKRYDKILEEETV
jgi:hypothetical protein